MDLNHEDNDLLPPPSEGVTFQDPPALVIHAPPTSQASEGASTPTTEGVSSLTSESEGESESESEGESNTEGISSDSEPKGVSHLSFDGPIFPASSTAPPTSVPSRPCHNRRLPLHLRGGT